MPSNHLILCGPLHLLPSIFASIRVIPNESAFRIRGPKYWSFSFNISPSNEHPGLISFRMDSASVNFICYLSTSEFCLYIANHITKDPPECGYSVGLITIWVWWTVTNPVLCTHAHFSWFNFAMFTISWWMWIHLPSVGECRSSFIYEKRTLCIEELRNWLPLLSALLCISPKKQNLPQYVDLSLQKENPSKVWYHVPINILILTHAVPPNLECMRIDNLINKTTWSIFLLTICRNTKEVWPLIQLKMNLLQALGYLLGMKKWTI